ncbi:hypothetical protein CAOG_001233 [Capsaspora owczarzaki ATCC 30864]|uniref:Transcription initiation factor TFIID subunit 2 n=2 Tax=Capsaspora owczarzaki (strain ATCC 30864) TaxID=595528 RepID=A0A0D2WJY9_CAPO3|nr:hypothetical protein CAOG_001233 [Capsaspora owczarzaki ATCC 30864]
MPCVDTLTDRCKWDIHVIVNPGLSAVCSGDLLSQQQVAPGNRDEGWRYFHYALNVPTVAGAIGIAVGPFDIWGDPHANRVTHFALVGLLPELIQSTQMTGSSVEFFELYFGMPSPFGSYHQVFVEECFDDVLRFAGMSIFSSRLLHCERVIDQPVETRCAQAYALASQWIGFGITMERGSDEWLVEGLARYISGLFRRQMFGNNEYRWWIEQEMERVAQADVNLPPLCSDGLDVNDPALARFGELRRRKANLVLRLVEGRIGIEMVQRVVHTVFTRLKQATAGSAAQASANRPKDKDDDDDDDADNSHRKSSRGHASLTHTGTHGAVLSTKEFFKVVKKVSGHELKLFAEQLVYESGSALLEISMLFNKRRNAIEVECRQHVCTRRHPYGEQLTSSARASNAMGQSLSSDVLQEAMADHISPEDLDPDVANNPFAMQQRAKDAAAARLNTFGHARSTVTSATMAYYPGTFAAQFSNHLPSTMSLEEVQQHSIMLNERHGSGHNSSTHTASALTVALSNSGRGLIKTGAINFHLHEFDGAFDHQMRIEAEQQTMELPLVTKAGRARAKKKRYVLETGEDIELDLIAVERDINVQHEAIKKLADRPSLATWTTLVKVLHNERVFHRLRLAAVFALASMASLDPNLNGIRYLMDEFRKRFCITSHQRDKETQHAFAYLNVKAPPSPPPPTAAVPNPPVVSAFTDYLVEPNDFTNFANYHLKKAFVRALGTIRLRRPGLRNPPCPWGVVRFLLDVLEMNDNSVNPYTDAHYIAAIIDGLAETVTDDYDLKPTDTLPFPYEHPIHVILAEFTRLLSLEKLNPSYRHVVAVSCLNGMSLIQARGVLTIDIGVFSSHARYGHFTDVRLAAMRGLWAMTLVSPLASAATIATAQRAIHKLLKLAERDPEPMVRCHAVLLLLERPPPVTIITHDMMTRVWELATASNAVYFKRLRHLAFVLHVTLVQSMVRAHKIRFDPDAPRATRKIVIRRVKAPAVPGVPPSAGSAAAPSDLDHGVSAPPASMSFVVSTAQPSVAKSEPAVAVLSNGHHHHHNYHSTNVVGVDSDAQAMSIDEEDAEDEAHGDGADIDVETTHPAAFHDADSEEHDGNPLQRQNYGSNGLDQHEEAPIDIDGDLLHPAEMDHEGGTHAGASSSSSSGFVVSSAPVGAGSTFSVKHSTDATTAGEAPVQHEAESLNENVSVAAGDEGASSSFAPDNEVAPLVDESAPLEQVNAQADAPDASLAPVDKVDSFASVDPQATAMSDAM